MYLFLTAVDELACDLCAYTNSASIFACSDERPERRICEWARACTRHACTSRQMRRHSSRSRMRRPGVKRVEAASASLRSYNAFTRTHSCWPCPWLRCSGIWHHLNHPHIN
eukprot:1572271-Pleurochrysis_carterae.AAC.5